MTLAARHLEPRRPRKDRDVTWSRSRAHDGGVQWSLWRRDRRNALHLMFVTLTAEQLNMGLDRWTAQRIRDAKRKLRDQVDEIDLALMEQTA